MAKSGVLSSLIEDQNSSALKKAMQIAGTTTTTFPSSFLYPFLWVLCMAKESGCLHPPRQWFPLGRRRAPPCLPVKTPILKNCRYGNILVTLAGATSFSLKAGEITSAWKQPGEHEFTLNLILRFGQTCTAGLNKPGASDTQESCFLVLERVRSAWPWCFLVTFMII